MQIEAGRKFQVNASTYESQIRFLTPDLSMTNRTHCVSRDSTFIDVYPFWFLGFASLPPKVLAVRSGQEFFSQHGAMAIYIPPFTVIEWRVHAAEIQWQGFSSPNPLPDFGFSGAVLFKWDSSPPASMAEIQSLLTSRDQVIEIASCRENSTTAFRTKEYIDRHFKEDLKISEVADRLKISRFFMTRAFRRAFGLSPVVYRNKLRVFESIRLMHLGSNVTTAGIEAGFSSSSRYIDRFRHYIGTNPASYNGAKNSFKSERV